MTIALQLAFRRSGAKPKLARVTIEATVTEALSLCTARPWLIHRDTMFGLKHNRTSPVRTHHKLHAITNVVVASKVTEIGAFVAQYLLNAFAIQVANTAIMLWTLLEATVLAIKAWGTSTEPSVDVTLSVSGALLIIS